MMNIRKCTVCSEVRWCDDATLPKPVCEECSRPTIPWDEMHACSLCFGCTIKSGCQTVPDVGCFWKETQRRTAL